MPKVLSTLLSIVWCFSGEAKASEGDTLDNLKTFSTTKPSAPQILTINEFETNLFSVDVKNAKRVFELNPGDWHGNDLEKLDHNFKLCQEAVFATYPKYIRKFENGSLSISNICLPSEMVDNFLGFMTPKELLSYRLVNRSWKKEIDNILSNTILTVSVQKLLADMPKSLPPFRGWEIIDDCIDTLIYEEMDTEEITKEKENSVLKFLSLPEAKNVDALSLTGYFVTDSVFAAIANTEANLKIIKVDSPFFSDEGIKALNGLTDLIYLNLGNYSYPEYLFTSAPNPEMTQEGIQPIILNNNNLKYFNSHNCNKIRTYFNESVMDIFKNLIVLEVYYLGSEREWEVKFHFSGKNAKPIDTFPFLRQMKKLRLLVNYSYPYDGEELIKYKKENNEPDIIVV